LPHPARDCPAAEAHTRSKRSGDSTREERIGLSCCKEKRFGLEIIFLGWMLAGALCKAHHGKLFIRAPIGYAKVPSGGLVLDPGEEGSDVVQPVFHEFDELGTVSARLRYLVCNGKRLNVRVHFERHKGDLLWRRSNWTALTFLIHHPVYVRAYTHSHST
jgi:hypothetical protein